MLTVAGVGWNDDTEALRDIGKPAARAVTLTAHQAAVRDRAGEIARNLGLPDPSPRPSCWQPASTTRANETRDSSSCCTLATAGSTLQPPRPSPSQEWTRPTGPASGAPSGYPATRRDAPRGTVCPHRRQALTASPTIGAADREPETAA